MGSPHFRDWSREETSVTSQKREIGSSILSTENFLEIFVVTVILLCFISNRVEAGGDQCHQPKNVWSSRPMREAQPRGDKKSSFASELIFSEADERQSVTTKMFGQLKQLDSCFQIETKSLFESKYSKGTENKATRLGPFLFCDLSAPGCTPHTKYTHGTTRHAHNTVQSAFTPSSFYMLGFKDVRCKWSGLVKKLETLPCEFCLHSWVCFL